MFARRPPPECLPTESEQDNALPLLVHVILLSASGTVSATLASLHNVDATNFGFAPMHFGVRVVS